MSERMADALFRVRAKEIDSLRARVAQLEEALRPFAESADDVSSNGYTEDDDYSLSHFTGDDYSGLWTGKGTTPLSLKHLFDARAALAQPPGEWLRGQIAAALLEQHHAHEAELAMYARTLDQHGLLDGIAKRDPLEWLERVKREAKAEARKGGRG